MDVSFIVPALNEEKCIEKTLKSIKAQKTKLKFEVIVSDGMSEDRTVAIAKRYATVVKCKTRGIAHGRNVGAEKTKGKLLVFIDADTTIPEDYIDKVWTYMSAHKDVSALTARIEFDFEKRYLTFVWKTLELWLRFLSFFGRGMLIGVNFVVWKNVFREIGGFPEVPSEDVAIKPLLLKHGRTVYYKGTYARTSGRRFDEDPLGIVPYYLFRDIVTHLRMSKYEKAKTLSHKVEKKMEKHVKYKEIR